MDNPFATPQADLSFTPNAAAGAANAYRDGELLVISRSGASLPDVCVKTGAPTGERLQRKLHWYPQWTYLFLLFNAIIFIIVAMIVRKTADLDFALCAEARDERKKHMFIGLGIIGLGVLLFFGAGVSPFFIIAGAIVLFIGIIYMAVKSRLVWPTKMDKEWAWVKGVNPRVLSELPIWGG